MTASIVSSITDQQPQIESLLPAYIARQRWFGGKSRTIALTRIASMTPLGDTAVIALIEITYTDTGETDLYQLPLAFAPPEQATSLQATAPKSIIATVNDDVLFDASADTTFQRSLFHLIIDGTSSEVLAATRASTLDPTRFTNLPSRLSSAEQSNTSILYEPLAILKLFRHLRPGAENPDVEIARFLTEFALFSATPTYLGDLHRASDNTTLAFLQSFAPNEGDGWAWTLTQLESFYKSVAGAGAPHLASDMWAPPDPDLSDHAATYLEAAALLGRRTAELHLALATPTQDPAFAAEPYTADDLIHDHQRIAAQVNTTLDQLSAALPQLDPSIIANANALLGTRQQLLTKISALTGDPATFGHRIRIHGDYHLGQLLRTESRVPSEGISSLGWKSDFLIVDFEGEPARSLAERRQKQSPLRDVAGMLRSFSYAAHTGLANAIQLYPNAANTLTPWAATWQNAVSTAFLTSYRTTIAANPALLPSPHQQDTLLSALLLEKALYELRYELNNRPAWVSIPLEGLRKIIAS